MHGRRLEALDGLRGLAILLVLIVHVNVPLGEGRVDRLASFLTSGGWMGVDLFFVLSGFLISGLLIDARGKPAYFRAFYARRVLRIFPLYYLFVAFLVFVAPHLGTTFSLARMDGREWTYWLYLVNVDHWLHGMPGTNFRHVWSLAVEEQAYILWPLAVALCPPQRLRWVCLALLPAALAWRVGLVLTGSDPAGPYQLLPSRMDAFAIGALVALAWRSPAWPRLARWWPVSLLAGGVVLAIGASTGSLDSGETLMETVGFTATGLAGGGALVFALVHGRWLTAPWLRRLGTYSYAIYLFHLPLWEVVGRHVPLQIGGSALLARGLALTLMLGLCYAGGWLSYTLLERHILALKRFVPYGAEPRAAVALPRVPTLTRPAAPAADPMSVARRTP